MNTNILVAIYLLLISSLISACVPATPTFDKGIQDPESGHWYLVLPTMGWDNAIKHCASLGGHLVIIDNASENNFVYINLHLPHGGILLGATDKEKEGDWLLATGEKMQYTNWSEGEPNNCGDLEVNGYCTPEHVLAYYPDDPGKWNDVPGEGGGDFVCEFEK